MLSRFAFALVTCASVCLVVPAATAADMVTKAPRLQPAETWTGFYGGVSIGYASGQVTRGTPSFAATDNLAPNSFVATLLGGYDHQFNNNLVLGIRLAVPFFSLSDTTPGPGVTFGAKVKNAVIVAGRAGYSLGQWMPYVMGGGVWGTGEAQVLGIGTVEAKHAGYIIGVGAEYRLYRNWSIDANYSFISMDQKAYNFVPFGGSSVVHGFESHNFMIGANYRF